MTVIYGQLTIRTQNYLYKDADHNGIIDKATQQEHKRCRKQVGPGMSPESGARLGSSCPPLSFQVNLRLEMGRFQVPGV